MCSLSCGRKSGPGFAQNHCDRFRAFSHRAKTLFPFRAAFSEPLTVNGQLENALMHAGLGNKDVECCSTPRWGQSAPAPTLLIFNEKMGVWGHRTQTGMGGSPFSCTDWPVCGVMSQDTANRKQSHGAPLHGPPLSCLHVIPSTRHPARSSGRAPYKAAPCPSW